MNAVYLDRIGWALGSERGSVEDAAAAGRLVSLPEALRDAGFATHHRCQPGETAYDLARAAVTGDLGDVGSIVYSTCLPCNATIGSDAAFRESRDVKCLMDFPASHLQADLGLGGASVIGLAQQACTGMIGALRLARGLLAAEPELSGVLCLTADRFPEGALYEQSYNLISDGAASCVVSREPRGWRIMALHAITNGALARASDDETAGSYFVFTCRAVQETLARAGLTMAQVDWVVAQNMNRKALDVLGRLLAVPPGRLLAPTLPEVGHVISGDNLINLRTLDDAGRIAPGQRVLLTMAGYGLNWQCAVLEKV